MAKRNSVTPAGETSDLGLVERIKAEIMKEMGVNAAKPAKITVGKAKFAICAERRKAKAGEPNTHVVAIFRKGMVGQKAGFMLDTVPTPGEKLADFLETLESVADLKLFIGELREAVQAVRDAKPGRTKKDTASYFDFA